MTQDRPRVTYVIDDLGHGGAQRQLFHTVRALDGAANLSVVVLSDLTEPWGPRIHALGVPVETIPRRTSFDATRALALAQKFRALNTGIAHAMLDAADGYTFLAARARRIPAVLSLRSDRLTTTGGRARMLGWMMRNASAVTTNSRAGRDYLLGRIGVRAERVHLVPNIIDLPPDASPPAADGGPVIGAVGRLVALKRFEAVIDALVVVRRAIPDARVVVIGDGPARPGLENLARREGVANAVEFAGAVDDATARMSAFACLVVASAHEGLPNAALEALARGVPVVAVPAGDLPRIIQDGVTGVLARDASPESLADAIGRALSIPTLRESARREGPRLIRDEFSAERARAGLIDLYSRLPPSR